MSNQVAIFFFPVIITAENIVTVIPKSSGLLQESISMFVLLTRKQTKSQQWWKIWAVSRVVSCYKK